MKDIPAFKDESYISSKSDFIQKIDFQLAKIHRPNGTAEDIISTWPKLIESFLKRESFGGYIEKSEKSSKKILETELKLSEKSGMEKAKAIINYIKANWSWNEYYGKVASKSVKEFQDQKSGSAGDMNLFMVGMLRAAGIDAYPVILSTRGNGRIVADYPFENFFNYVIAYITVEGKSFLADATEHLLPFSVLPIRCINGQGLLIKEGAEHWVDLESPVASKQTINLTMEIFPESPSVKVKGIVNFSEMEAYLYKSSFGKDSVKLKEVLVNDHLEEISSMKIVFSDDPVKPYVIGFEGVGSLEQIADKIVLHPLLGWPMQENKLTQETRTYPVDFVYAKSESYRSTIKIPDGYKVIDVPEIYELSNNLAVVKVEYINKETTLEMVANFSLNQAVYMPKDYEALKSILDTVVKKFNAPLVFEKI